MTLGCHPHEWGPHTGTCYHPRGGVPAPSSDVPIPAPAPPQVRSVPAQVLFFQKALNTIPPNYRLRRAQTKKQ